MQAIRRKVDEATVCPHLDSDNKCELQENIHHAPTPLNKQWSESSCGTEEEKEECEEESIELEPTPPKVPPKKCLQEKVVYAMHTALDMQHLTIAIYNWQKVHVILPHKHAHCTHMQYIHTPLK